MGDIWEIIKSIFSNPCLHETVNNGLMNLLCVCLGIIVILIIALFLKSNKEYKQMRRDQRKHDKQTLKFISKKKNKTW